MKRNFELGFILLIFIFGFKIKPLHAQDFMLQGWYWDYPKTANGYLWADTLRLKAQELSEAGFTYIWLPSLSRAASGSISNGYDPKDLYDLGEYGLGPTGFGARSDVDALIAAFDSYGIKAVADVVYNHRDGGKPENNPSVAGWIRNMTWAKINNGDQPYPSDRFRLILTVGGSTGRGIGTYYFKLGSKSQHAKFFNFPYKVYLETKTVGYQGLPPDTESEPNGGGGVGEPNNPIRLGVDMHANIDAAGNKIDEFALTLNTGDFNAAGDTIFIYLNNREVNGLDDYSDHTVLELYYSGGGGNIENAIAYQTWTDFLNMPSASGTMNHPNFKPNGNPTQLAGDWDAMYFFYDYDQNVTSTRTGLFDWTRWLWNDAGIAGFRMDAVKHFPYDFVGDLLDNLHDNGIDPGMVVGEFFDSNPASLQGWVNNVLANMDNDTKAAIIPRIFDFSLRYALEAASDQFGYDARNVFNASIVDAQGMSGFNAVTFVDNHDFRSAGQPVDNDPMLAYAYILTNNQVGLPCVYYYDYYNRGLKNKIDSLLKAHQDYIFGATQRDYLSRFSTPYYQNFISGYASTTLIYQLSGAVAGRDVVVAINYAGETLKIDQQVNTTSMGLAKGDTLTDMLGNSASRYEIIDANGRIYIELPPRSYSVWVEGSFEKVLLETKIFLEGPYKPGDDVMTTHLSGLIPTTSPYAADPRSVSSVPANVTDWVLVQLRSTATGVAIASRSAFLNRDGRIVADDGTTGQISIAASEDDYYVVIKHRNHLSVMSAAAVALSRNSFILYDFTTGTGKFYGSGGAKELKSGVWGMIAGDGNGDGGVYAEDYTIYKTNQGYEGYHPADYNLDSGVYAEDYTLRKQNQGKETAVPD